jgi:hypothetical protein
MDGCLMGSRLKTLLFSAAVCILCWGGAVWYWRNNNTLPNSGDLVLYLVLLPMVILFLLWFARKLVLLAAAPAAAASAAPAAPAAAPPPPQPVPPLHLVAGALRLPHGASSGELRAAFAASEAHPDLDAELADDHGYPVMSARVPGLDTSATEADVGAWRAGLGLPDPDFHDEQWRALALGADVAAELGQAASAHQHVAAYADATPAARAALALPMLQLVPLLPSGWTLAQRVAAGRWLLHLVAQQGWPADRLALSAAAERGGADPLALADELAAHSLRENLPCLAIVLACASHLGETTLDQWSGQGILFSARNQRGQIPGEGAAGLLLADAAQAALLDPTPAPELHGVVRGARSASADAIGQVDAALLGSLALDALRGAVSVAGDVQLVASDADQRGSRVAELLSAAAAAAPQLDAALQVIGVATGCGQAGPAGALAALVLARQEVADNASHVLYLSNQDPYQRSAAVIRPRPEPAAAAA